MTMSMIARLRGACAVMHFDEMKTTTQHAECMLWLAFLQARHEVNIGRRSLNAIIAFLVTMDGRIYRHTCYNSTMFPSHSLSFTRHVFLFPGAHCVKPVGISVAVNCFGEHK